MPQTDQPALSEGTTDSDLATRPLDAEGLLQLIAQEYESLPRQLKRIASYMSQQRDRIMVDRISDIARECEVHPSAIVRFSQRLGFRGFSDMQALFREAYTHKATPVQNYQQRIRSLIANKSQKASSADLARDCIGATLSGIERLEQELDEAALSEPSTWWSMPRTSTWWGCGAPSRWPTTWSTTCSTPTSASTWSRGSVAATANRCAASAPATW